MDLAICTAQAVMDNSSVCPPNATVCEGDSCVVPESNFNAILNTVMSTVLTILLAMVMFSMGCNVEVHKFLGHIKRPWGIFVGFLCHGLLSLMFTCMWLSYSQSPKPDSYNKHTHGLIVTQIISKLTRQESPSGLLTLVRPL